MNNPMQKFRLVTRSDFDGLVCALLLKEINLINEIKFVHPKDVQDGEIKIDQNDITANLPFSGDAYYAFDHHISELARVGSKANYIIDPQSPSAARLIYRMFGGKEGFPNISEEMMHEVDKSDTADYTVDEVINPTGWTMLGFIMDSRTGLGRFRDFRISNYQLMMDLVELCHKYQDAAKILAHPDVAERVQVYHEQQGKFLEMLKSRSSLERNVIYLDLLNQDTIYAGNRFMLYTLYPEANVSVQSMWRTIGQKVVFAVGKSIFNRSLKTNIGHLMLEHGGGGHAAAGTCQVDLAVASKVKNAIFKALMGD